MNYENASDKEINEKVATKLGLKPLDDGRTVFILVSGAENTLEIRGYCNNPLDAWPIMEQYGIATIVENGIVVGATNNSQEFYEPLGSVVHSYLHTNALRAAMIVFLMMQDKQCQKK